MTIIEHAPEDGRASVAWFETLAQRATERALDAFANEDTESAAVELSLADACMSAAFAVGIGAANQEGETIAANYILTDDGGYETYRGDCTCPPELVARGGFQAGCPVHDD
jgi:hypothetical protein